MTARTTVADSDIERGLAGLRTAAPARLAAATLVAVGLADEYTTMSSPIGPVFVAWNGRGVSTVAQAADPAEFESWFRGEMGRPIHRAETVPPRLERALARRIAGDRRARIDLDLRSGSEFERAV